MPDKMLYRYLLTSMAKFRDFVVSAADCMAFFVARKGNTLCLIFPVPILLKLPGLMMTVRSLAIIEIAAGSFTGFFGMLDCFSPSTYRSLRPPSPLLPELTTLARLSGSGAIT